MDPPHQTGHYAAYHRFVHDIQHRGDVMRYLEALGFLNIQLGYGPTKYGTELGFKVVGGVGR